MSLLQALDSTRPWARGGARDEDSEPEDRPEPEGEEDALEDEAPVPTGPGEIASSTPAARPASRQVRVNHAVRNSE